MRHRIFIGAAATALLLVAAGCSSSSNNNGAAAGPSGSAAGGTAIKVGMICSCSGPFGTTIASAGKVTQAWAKSVNAAGGINGHPINLTVYDDAGNPGTSVTKAQALISAHVDVILDETPLDAAWAKNAADAKIPVVGGNFSSTPYYTDPDFYPSGQTNDSIVYANVLTAKQAGATNLGQLYCAEAPQCQESVAPHKAAGKKLGVPVIYSASISATAPNYTAQCLAAKQAHVSALFIGDSASIIARVAQDCDRQGYDPIYISEGTGFTLEDATAPGLKDKLWSAYPVLPFFADQAPVQQMNTVLDKYYPGLRTDQKTWSGFATQAWTGGLLIEAGVKNSGVAANAALSPAAVIKGLDTLKNETLGGWSPPLTFTAGKPHPVDCWFTARVQGGKPAMANNGKLTCQKGSS